MSLNLDRGQLKLDAKGSMRGHRPSVYLVTLVYLLILYILGVLATLLMYPGLDFNRMASLQTMTEDQLAEMYQLMLRTRPSFFAQLLDVAIEIMGTMLGVGFLSFCLSVSRGQEAGFSHLFDGFGNFLNLLLLEILISIFVFLWSLLLIVPGIIAAYRYSMAVFIMLDTPDKNPIQCIRESKELTAGHKGALFLLDLSFLGWYLLSVIPFVSIYVLPYVNVTKANYYRTLSGRWEEPAHVDVDI